ncbi:MAG TPA: SDR family oxidoreductase [Pedobacter sp.]
MSKILVTGATGHLGNAITESLLKKTNADRVNILVRDPEKAAEFKAKGVNVLTGDYNDADSLVNAFKGIDKLYLVSGNDIPNRAGQHESIINAAKKAGVKHIVYSSFQRKEDSEDSAIAFVAVSHIYTENLLKTSGLTYTILRHALYTDMIPIFAGEHLLENKSIYLPAGSGKSAFALRADLAEAGANVLLDETGKYDNREIELTGPESLSWEQIAAIISEITGENITYTSPSVTEFTAALTNAGVPDEYIGIFAGFSKAIDDNEFEEANDELGSLLGRQPVTIAAYLQTVYGK